MSELILIWEGEMLTDPFNGIYTCWSYYSDGSVKETKIPKGPIIIPIHIPVW